jgi:CubicO group peptidase (beta-lactamase class C family)
LKGSAFGDATLRQVLNMTVAADFSENYGDPNANIRDYGYALGFGKEPGPNYRGPRDLSSYLRTVRKIGEHGQTFRYMTITTEVLTWVVTRVAQKSLSDLFSEMIWTPDRR